MMNGLQTAVQWITDNPLRGAGLVYGAAIAVVILYTFLISDGAQDSSQ